MAFGSLARYINPLTIDPNAQEDDQAQLLSPLQTAQVPVTGGLPGQAFDLFNGNIHTRTPLDGSGPPQTFDYSVAGGGRPQTPQSRQLADASQFMNNFAGPTPLAPGGQNATPQALALHELAMTDHGRRMQNAQQTFGQVIQDQLGQGRLGFDAQRELYGMPATPTAPRIPGMLEQRSDEGSPTRENAKGYREYLSRALASGMSGEDARRTWIEGGLQIPQLSETNQDRSGRPATNLANTTNLNPTIRSDPLRRLLGEIARPPAAGIQAGQTPPRVPVGDFVRSALASPLVSQYLDAQNFPNFMRHLQDIYAAPDAGGPSFNDWWTSPYPVMSRNDTSADLARQALEQRIGAIAPGRLQQTWGARNWFSPIAFGSRGNRAGGGIMEGVGPGLFGTRGSYYNSPLPADLFPTSPVQR